MPRSLRSCYDEITSALSELARLYDAKHPCHAQAARTAQQLAASTVAKIFSAGLHEFLIDFTDRNAKLAAGISDAYHFTE